MFGMGRGRPRRGRRSGGTLETGLGLAAFGIFLLLLPVFMDEPLQQSALEPLEPVGWILLIAGAAIVAFCFRPSPRRKSHRPDPALARARGERRPKVRSALPSRREERRKEAETAAAMRAAVRASFADDGSLSRTLPPGESQPAFPDTELISPEELAAWRNGVADQPAGAPSSQPPTHDATPDIWSPRVLQMIEWKRLEEVVERLFRQAGFKTRSQPHPSDDNSEDGLDGGSADIWLYSRHARNAVSIVLCRHGSGRPVTAGEVHQFLDLMGAQNLRRGTYVSTSGFTPDALEFARNNGIHAMDGQDLLALIEARTPEQQKALLEVAFEGEYWRPTCPNCSIKLVERGNAKNGSLFWACLNSPQCRTRMQKSA